MRLERRKRDVEMKATMRVFLTLVVCLLSIGGSFTQSVGAATMMQSSCNVRGTPWFMELYGNFIIDGVLAPTGTLIEAGAMRDGEFILAGCHETRGEGIYGFIRIYGEDPTANPPITGMRTNEEIILKFAGRMVNTGIIWKNDWWAYRYNVGQDNPIPSTTWADYYGYGSFSLGDVVEAFDQDGTLCGQFEVTTNGEWGLMHVYQDDGGTPVDEGASSGEELSFFVNGSPAEVVGEPVLWALYDLREVTLLVELPTPTPTATPTNTSSPTPTLTNTPTSTFTPTPSPTATATPTNTSTPTVTSTPIAPSSCVVSYDYTEGHVAVHIYNWPEGYSALKVCLWNEGKISCRDVPSYFPIGTWDESDLIPGRVCVWSETVPGYTLSGYDGGHNPIEDGHELVLVYNTPTLMSTTTATPTPIRVSLPLIFH
jgi:hypothetical protein